MMEIHHYGGILPLAWRPVKESDKKLGRVDVDMGGTACKVPLALEYIEKLEKSGRVGKKRKTTRC